MIVSEGINKTASVMKNDQLTDLLKQFWETESLGTDNDEKELIENGLLRHVEFIDGHYQIHTPAMEKRCSRHIRSLSIESQSS